jgi:glutamate N-acetyltransferase/amino-acid N-acetyltransferase
MTVTAPAGFRAAGVAAGIKSGGGLDLALVVNDGPETAAAGVFTRNRVKAAPVLWSQLVLRGGMVRAVVLNSGGANACTGPAGFQDTHATAEHAAARLAGLGIGGGHGAGEPGDDGSGVGAGEVAVCSTGLIGVRLPMDRLLAGVDAAAAALSRDGGRAAAEAIMTTDTRPKTVAVTVPAVPAGCGGSVWTGGSGRSDGFTVGGMAKGAGMLAPALEPASAGELGAATPASPAARVPAQAAARAATGAAVGSAAGGMHATMLCVLTTDAVAGPNDLAAALDAAVRVSFERVDSDGCMSTNDTVLLLASGASGIAPGPDQLTGAVTAACTDLARQLVADAEGATKQVAVEVTGAANQDDAVLVGRAVARSNLVKTAMFGGDPNWGRILAAVGTTRAAYAPDRLDVAVNRVWVCRSGQAAEDPSAADLTGPEVTVQVVLHAGEAAATVWTNDLSHGYVHENSAYST